MSDKAVTPEVMLRSVVALKVRLSILEKLQGANNGRMNLRVLLNSVAREERVGLKFVAACILELAEHRKLAHTGSTVRLLPSGDKTN